METAYHLLGILCYTLGSVYYTVALVQLARKRQ
jgi:hypothetical protein